MAITKFEGDYAFLHNFYVCNMSEWGNRVQMSTVEHHYQSRKAAGWGKRDEILAAATPEEARMIASRIRASKRTPNWNSVKEKHMKELIKRKFSLNPELRKKLVATGEEELVYGNTEHDNFWGKCTCSECVDLVGENKLGKILMDFRKKYLGKGPRFINDDIKLRHGGRRAVKLTVEELEDRLQKQYESLTGDSSGNFISLCAVEELLSSDKTVQKDNKYIASFAEMSDDDSDYNGTGKSLLGFHTLDNGLTIYGFVVEGDETGKIFALFYHDGKKIRLYTPIRGNLVNTDCKCAIGGIPSDDVDYDKLEAKYRKLGVWYDDDDYNHVHDMYLSKYDIYPGSEDFNWTAMEEDIKARIEVI